MARPQDLRVESAIEGWAEASAQADDFGLRGKQVVPGSFLAEIRGVRFDGNVCSNKTILLRVLKKVPKMRDGVWKTQEHNGTQGLGSGFPDAKRFCFFFNLGMDMGSFRGIFKLRSMHTLNEIIIRISK